MFPGQFSNANKCLRVSNTSGSYLYTGTLNVTGGSYPCTYFMIQNIFGSASLQFDKGIGNLHYFLIGGGGGGGTSGYASTAGRGGDGGSINSSWSTNPNATGVTVSVGSTPLAYSITNGNGGAGGSSTSGSAGETTSFTLTSVFSASAGGGAGGTYDYSATGTGGAGYSPPDGAHGGDGILASLLMQNPTDTSNATPLSWKATTNTITAQYIKYGAGGGGGDTIRRASFAAYTNKGGANWGGFGMEYPIGESLWSPAAGGYGSGGGGGGTLSSADGGYSRGGASGGNGVAIFRFQY